MIDETIDDVTSFWRKLWHWTVNLFAAFGALCATALVLTLVGLWHVVHGLF